MVKVRELIVRAMALFRSLMTLVEARRCLSRRFPPPSHCSPPVSVRWVCSGGAGSGKDHLRNARYLRVGLFNSSYATTAPEKLPPRVCDLANSQYRLLNVVHAYGLSTTSAYLSARRDHK